MPQSLAQIYIHLVFSTKDRESWISPTVQPRLHSYLAGTLNAIDCPAVEIGGMPDHVHLLFRLGRTVTLSDVVKSAKVESSKWMKEEGATPAFAWQAGYGAFSVSASMVDTTIEYIRNQAEHHATRSFQDEFRALLQRYQIEYNEAYVWDCNHTKRRGLAVSPLQGSPHFRWRGSLLPGLRSPSSLALRSAVPPLWGFEPSGSPPCHSKFSAPRGQDSKAKGKLAQPTQPW